MNRFWSWTAAALLFVRDTLLMAWGAMIGPLHFLLPLLMLATGGRALAQGAGLPTFDPVSWGSNPFELGAVLLFLIAAIKRAVEQSALKDKREVHNPWLWRGVAVVMGQAGAFGLHYGRFGAELNLYGMLPPLSVAAFGLVAAGVAMGFRDLLKTALGWLAQAWATKPSSPATAQKTVPASTQPGQGTIVATTVATTAPPSGLENLGPREAPAAPPAASEPLPSGLEDGPPPEAFDTAPRALLGLPSLGGLTSLPPAVQATLTGLLAQAFGGSVPAQVAVEYALRLAPLVPDLADGSPYLSADNRNRVLDIVLDLKKKAGLT
ncbi:hypothetical protein [Deinococcus budaensis]|uniref:Uncharacterized protein n=1 Tax=Deinococcus budaensis TaxID=1665626 RepID=A0A7W8GF53_9DEIO|nr:hypothetical protein [Deinococcus budaensis]MBB5234491.1 hypothetical protein [Deinococcus budaensis]